MTNVLGGGGGKEGFRHLVTHLGPAVQNWTQGMKDHEFVPNENNIRRLDESVQEMLAVNEPTEVEKQRDEAFIDLIKRKSNTVPR